MVLTNTQNSEILHSLCFWRCIQRLLQQSQQWWSVREGWKTEGRWVTYKTRPATLHVLYTVHQSVLQDAKQQNKLNMFLFDEWFIRGRTDHGDHAIVLFPGTTASEEGDEENHHTDADENNGSTWGWCIIDHEGFMQSYLNQDAHDNQC